MLGAEMKGEGSTLTILQLNNNRFPFTVKKDLNRNVNNSTGCCHGKILKPGESLRQRTQRKFNLNVI